MAVLTKLTHVTRYVYDKPVVLSPQLVRLRPAPHSRTAVPAYALKVTPENHFVNWQQDPHGNWLARFVFPEPTSEFSVSVDLLAEMAVYNPLDFFIEDYAEHWPFAYAPELAKDLAPFLECEEEGDLFEAYLATIPRDRKQTTDFVVAVNQALHRSATRPPPARGRARLSPSRPRPGARAAPRPGCSAAATAAPRSARPARAARSVR